MIFVFIIISVFCAYMGLLFWLAIRTESGDSFLHKLSSHPLIYSLAIGIYCSTWTYYGSVGSAATSGIGFLAVYLGPTLIIFFWPLILRKMARIKHDYRITSIADFISARYNKSQLLAALVTIIALIGVVPYVALQLRATFATFKILITYSLDVDAFALENVMSWLIIAIMILFTILFGARRLDPTETHKGMILSVAIQSLVQLGAILCVGVFVTYFVFNGFSDIFTKLGESEFSNLIYVGDQSPGSYMVWGTYFVLSMSAFMFLPRQFHVAVVENSNENHIKTAMWCFPLYMFLMNIFLVPIAMGGLLSGLPVTQADSYVLHLPLFYNKFWLALIVFMGGISAAASMIMISSMTVATMMTNHLLLPVITATKKFNFFKLNLLRCRWVFIAAFILLSYMFEHFLLKSYMLANIGLISFAAVLQFAPAILGGLYWRKANRRGALLGLSSGFMVWFYTLLMPTIIRSGWGATSLLEQGPCGIALLKPESILGISLENNMVHAVFWSMLINICFFVFGSLSRSSSESEQNIADAFIDVLIDNDTQSVLFDSFCKDKTVNLNHKLDIIRESLQEFFTVKGANDIIGHCLAAIHISQNDYISVVVLAELQKEIEKALTGSLGSGAANAVIKKAALFTTGEAKALSLAYAEILADFRLTPNELVSKIDFYKEKENLLTAHSKELENKIIALDKEISERHTIEKALIESEYGYRILIKSLPQKIFRKDVNSVYTFCNEIYAKDLGITCERIIGRDDFDFFPKKVAEKYRADDAQVIKNDIAQDFEEIYVIDGEEIWIHTVKTPIKNDEGQIIGVLGIFWDISERKRSSQRMEAINEDLEQRVKARTSELILSNNELQVKVDELQRVKAELEKANDNLRETKSQLFQTEKLASIGQIASGVAHEINKPVNFINRNFDILSAYGDGFLTYINKVQDLKLAISNKDLEKSIVYVNQIVAFESEFNLAYVEKDLPVLINESKQGIERMKKIIDDLKIFSNVEKGEQRDVDINEIIDKAINIVWNEIKYKAGLVKEYGDIPKVKCNAQQIVKVIVNIILNAAQAMDGSGMITLKTYQKDHSAFIEIHDTGCGIPDDVKNKIFEPFFSTKNTDERSGLGLSICYDIIKKYDGTFDVISEVGKGTTLIISLPIQ